MENNNIPNGYNQMPNEMQNNVMPNNGDTLKVLQDEIERFKKTNARNNVIIIALLVILIFLIGVLGFKFLF